MNKWTRMVAIAAVMTAACSNDPQEASPCGAGEEVNDGANTACVFRGELIEEGFTCPDNFETGFLLEDGGVACVGDEAMPDGLGDELQRRGYEPNEPGCFSDMEPDEACLYNPDDPNPDPDPDPDPDDNSAFDTDDATTISYGAGPGYGFCIEAGDLVSFELDLDTRMVQAQVAVPGPDGDDRCITDMFDGGCLIAEAVAFEITETQLGELITLLDAVPAPLCKIDQNLECDPCIVQSLAVDDTSVSRDCCGTEQAEDFGPAFDAVHNYLRSVLPETQPLFDDPATFGALEYSNGGGLGYCIEPGSLVSATVQRQMDGSLSIEGSTAEPGQMGVDDCMEGVIDGCLVETPFGPQTVDAMAQAQLETLLGDVPAPMCVDDPGRVCDPCLIENLDVDGVMASSFCCGTTALGYWDAFSAVIEHLNSL